MAQSLPVAIDPQLVGSGAVAGIYSTYALAKRPNLPTMSIMGVSTEDGTIVLPETAFQYWPESIQDTMEIGWEFTALPATSHPLAHWTQNGGRTINFEVTFARDMQYDPKASFLAPFIKADPDTEGVKEYNGNPDYMIKYLRAFAHPETMLDGTVLSPPICYVHLQGSSIGADGSDAFAGVMISCDVTYKRFGVDGDGKQGYTRLASVSLSFKEVIQNPTTPGEYKYHSMDTLFADGAVAVARNVDANTSLRQPMKPPFPTP